MSDQPAQEPKGPPSALIAGGVVLGAVGVGVALFVSGEPTVICAALPVGFGVVAVALLMLTPPVKRGGPKPPT